MWGWALSRTLGVSHCPSVWALEPLVKPQFYGCLAQLGHVPPPGFLKETPFCYLQLNKGSRCAKDPKSKILSYAKKLHHLMIFKNSFFSLFFFFLHLKRVGRLQEKVEETSPPLGLWSAVFILVFRGVLREGQARLVKGWEERPFASGIFQQNSQV